MIRPFFSSSSLGYSSVFEAASVVHTRGLWSRTRVRNPGPSLTFSFSLLPCSCSWRWVDIRGWARARGFACASSRGQANWLSFPPNLCPPAPPTIPLNRPSWLRDIMFLKYCRETNSPLHALRTFHALVYFSFRLTITSCCWFFDGSLIFLSSFRGRWNSLTAGEIHIVSESFVIGCELCVNFWLRWSHTKYSNWSGLLRDD